MVCNERETAVLKGEPMGIFGKMFGGGDKPVAVDGRGSSLARRHFGLCRRWLCVTSVAGFGT
jgi:hypothetical protein